jgi:hypothetical protein
LVNKEVKNKQKKKKKKRTGNGRKKDEKVLGFASRYHPPKRGNAALSKACPSTTELRRLLFGYSVFLLSGLPLLLLMEGAVALGAGQDLHSPMLSFHG